MGYIGMKEMLETGVHFGHQTRRWNPKMRPFIFGARKGIHIIDLQQTIPLFNRAYEFIVDVVANKGKVLFVGTKRQAQDIIQEEASRAGMYYITHRWMGGTLTNFKTIKHSIDRFKRLESMFEDGTINRFPKKEIVGMQRELTKLRDTLGGIKEMNEYPQAGFIVDPKREDIAVQEFRRLGIPIVAITDTNCDPDLIDYIIPGNDDAIRAIKLFTSRIAEACLEGQARQDEATQEEVQAAQQQAEAEMVDAQAATESNESEKASAEEE
ncbi:30S ribosomal protein S2 [Desulfovermiculus halophilus]|jgi:small subunit ribosomal protein S2|uniref:30S ribosomal protein S2 n=1 Tax=Desulfovermiculus halophilus TaxID=339722 RepID=UPI000481C8A5|nr:30S ribosomal protein S2 [Desulfovermiculus halophilus]